MQFLLLFLAMTFAASTQPATQPAGDVRFAAPAGWIISTKGKVTFFDAPDRGKADSCRIAVIGETTPIKNRQGGGSFDEIFELIQQPDPIVETTGTQRSKDKQGRDVLRVSKRVTDGGRDIWRSYYAVRHNDRFAFAIFTCSSKELLDKHSATFESFVQSLDVDPSAKPNDE